MDPKPFIPFAWPSVILLLGFTAIFALRKALTGLLGRLQKVKTPWGDFETTAANQQSRADAIRPLSHEMLSYFDSTLLQEGEKMIVAEVLEKRSIAHGEARERELLTLLAAALLTNVFEQTYVAIFGSQIGALQALNSAPEGLSTDTLRQWYDLGTIKEPEFYKNYSFELWLAFLESSVLIRRNGTLLCITVRGRNFLAYLTRSGHQLTKVG